MGYYTQYTLIIPEYPEISIEDDAKISKFLSEYKDENGGNYFAMILEGEPASHWDNDRDMMVLSVKFPHIKFELRGCGESDGDLWRKYYLNGKMLESRAKITFDEPEF